MGFSSLREEEKKNYCTKNSIFLCKHISVPKRSVHLLLLTYFTPAGTGMTQAAARECCQDEGSKKPMEVVASATFQPLFCNRDEITNSRISRS